MNFSLLSQKERNFNLSSYKYKLIIHIFKIARWIESTKSLDLVIVKKGDYGSAKWLSEGNGKLFEQEITILVVWHVQDAVFVLPMKTGHPLRWHRIGLQIWTQMGEGITSQVVAHQPEIFAAERRW